MRDFIKDPDTWLSVITVLIALFAIYQTKKQIKLSNKHQLFERRIDKYSLICDLFHMYSENRLHIINDDNLCEVVDLPFSWLTNNAYLAEMNSVIGHPLEQSEQNVFLIKCEKLEKFSSEISIIFKGKEAELSSRFVRQYSDLLRSMYKQQIALDLLNKRNVQEVMPLDVFKKLAKDYSEKVKLNDNLQRIDKTFEEMTKCNVLNKILNQVKL